MVPTNTFFAPQLYISKGSFDISFYIKAFNAVEHFCLRNDDGSIHVAELSINGALFHLHEESMNPHLHNPRKINASTVIIGLFTPDVAALMQTALKAGATEISPVTDYDYGYRQGELRDPFGHYWMIQCVI